MTPFTFLVKAIDSLGSHSGTGFVPLLGIVRTNSAAGAHSRKSAHKSAHAGHHLAISGALCPIARHRKAQSVTGLSKNGAKETRTPDPLHAMQVLYQLSYGPF